MQGRSRRQLLPVLLLLLMACTTAQEGEGGEADQKICQSGEDGECRNDEQEAGFEEEEDDVDSRIWESGLVWEMHHHLDCDEIIADRTEEGRMHNDESWQSLQETYKQVIGLEIATIPAVFDRSVIGYQVPIYIDFAKEEELGRGVFAKELIP